MKKTAVLLAACACLGFALLSAVSAADRDTTSDRTRGGHESYRSTDLMGKAVRNNAGDSLGHIDDFVINMKNGRIAYAVLAYGEVLGFGGKMFAIDAADLKMAEDRSALLFDVTKDELERSTGFDANKWPSAPADQFHKRGAAAGNTGKAVADAAATAATKLTGNDKDAELRRLSAIMRLAVKSEAGDSLGQVAGLSLDLHNRQVVYVAMSRGGVAGVGTHYYALPWNALECKSLDKTANKVFVINATKDDFDKHSGFEWRNWPTDADSRFKARSTRGS